MRLRVFVLLCLLPTVFLLTISLADAQQPKKVPRVGLLLSASIAETAPWIDAFRQGLRELDYIEGRNIILEIRGGGAEPDRIAHLATELVNLKVDIIVAAGNFAVQAAMKATSTIPIVIRTATDPVIAGYIPSLARPGGNITGLSALSAELGTKRLEILTDAVPKLARVALLWPGTGQQSQLKELRAAAPALKLKLEEVKTQADTKSLESAFRTAKQKQVDAIMTTQSRTFFAERKRIVELAVKYRLPGIYFQKEFVDEGGLMSYGADFDDLYRRAAVYVDKILKGAKPADLPVQQATKFEFVINLKAAKQIGLTIPVRVLEQANQIIK
ncbi:MAG TPA: ABC transporter substrate-binding protein [Candidatus Binatia bacterium]|nr:ABC transporter substrate-binding protein [Candidatus Binatia bacterium]